MSRAVTRYLQTTSLILFMAWCSTSAGTPPSPVLSDPPEGTIHPVLKSSQAEVIGETRRDPKYPRAAKKAGVGAQLITQVEIDLEGRVTAVQVARFKEVDPETCEVQSKAPGKQESDLSQEQQLDFAQAAADAITRWRYRPATQQGKPIKVMQLVIVTFCPKDTGITTVP